jgi:hypothetical protein
MADSKVSELTSATSVGGSDLFYLVQSNTSKKVTADVLFDNIANSTLKGTISLDSSVQTLAAGGIVNITNTITHLSTDATNASISIPAGGTNQLKIITMIATTGGAYTLIGNVAGSANVIFNQVGDTATMLYTNNKWHVIGGTANVSYP